MKIKDIMVILAVAVMTGGCNQQDDGLRQGDLVPIRLSASIDGSNTRTTDPTADTDDYTQDTQFLAGQAVDAYIKVKGGSWVTGLSSTTPRHFAAEGDGRLTRKSGEATDYYPMDATPVVIYAVHPSYTSAADFTVSTDQTKAADYAASDLCYSKTTEYNRQEAANTLSFNHVMSKLIVHVDVSGLGGTPTVSNLKVRAKTKTTMTYPTGSGDDYSLGTASTPAYISMNEDGAVIIPPQTTSAVGDVRISFEVSGIGPIAYEFPANFTFAPNTEYNYTVKVGETITVTSGIHPWGGTTDLPNTFTGYATPNLYDYEGIAVGDVIYSDGSWSTPANRSVGDNASKKVMAIVFATENQIATAHKEAGWHGYAISVFDTPEGELMWTTNTLPDDVAGITDVSWTYSGATGPANACAYFSNLNQPNHVNDGIYNTNEVLKLDLSKYPAFKAIDDYNKNAATKINGLKWFMPSPGEWILCFKNLANLSNYPIYTTAWDETWGAGIHDGLCWGPRWMTVDNKPDPDPVVDATNVHLSVAGTDGVDYNLLQKTCYWTSSEYISDHSAFRCDYQVGISYIRSSSTKENDYLVRPFLAF